MLSLRCLPLQRTRVTFEFADPVQAEQLGFCNTPPMLIDHRPPRDEPVMRPSFGGGSPGNARVDISDGRSPGGREGEVDLFL